MDYIVIDEATSFTEEQYEEVVKLVNKKKKTRRWCKGKKGVEHVTEWVNWADLKGVPYLKSWEIEVCKNCGKNLNMRLVS